MRLTCVLAKWPKTMPKGNIWGGTNRMVPKMLGPNKKRLMKQVEIEKSNLFYLMRPAVSFVSNTCLLVPIMSCTNCMKYTFELLVIRFWIIDLTTRTKFCVNYRYFLGISGSWGRLPQGKGSHWAQWGWCQIAAREGLVGEQRAQAHSHEGPLRCHWTVQYLWERLTPVTIFQTNTYKTSA